MSTMTNGRPAPALDSSTATSTTSAWSVHDASELYEVARWGNGYFSINPSGHVQVHATKDPTRAIDLKELIDRLQLRGISLPVLVRFTDIVKHRLGEIHAAFQAAISQHQYQGGYSCVFPIKEFLKVASSPAGKGWVSYKWPNSVSKNMEDKSTYIEKFGDVLIGVGIYK